MKHICNPKATPLFNVMQWQCGCGKYFTEFEAGIQIKKFELSEKTKMGLSKAKIKGIQLGRRLKIDMDWARQLRGMGASLTQISKELKVHRSTVSKALKRDSSFH